jgi:hypothetical protein
MNLQFVPTARTHKRAAVLAGISGAFLFAACASTPPEPTVAISAAEQAITVADRARIADTASPELNDAREKLTAAQKAVNDKEMIVAERLAIESRVNAELASAKAQAAKEKAVNDEIKRSTEILALEMRRTSGVK